MTAFFKTWPRKASIAVALGAAVVWLVGIAVAQTANPSADSAPVSNAGSGPVSNAGSGPIPPEQAQQLKAAVAASGVLVSGTIPEDQFEKLCAGAVAKHLGDDDIDNLATSAGLPPAITDRLKQCTHSHGAEPKPPSTLSGGNPAPAGAISAIEQEFRALQSPATKLEIPSPGNLDQFGYSVFSGPVSTFAPAANVGVSDDYILGPGDGLTVLLWGRMNQTLKLPVELDGTVLMPHIGPLQVSGLTFEQAKKLLESRAGQIEGVQVSVTMDSIRTIQVFVMGKVNQPGLYTVSALSHVSNALVAAGGISKVGTLRKIELRRGNKTVQVIDLYDLLLHGNSSGDVRLEPRDVLFVPVIGPVVGITGDVKIPAIYELPGETDLQGVLKLAGGVTAFGYGQRLQVDRIENHERRIALDLDISALPRSHFVIRDGDLLKVFPVLPEERNIVALQGNVNRPGSYQWRQGMRVSDLIHEGEGISDRTYLDYAVIRRRTGPAQKVEYLPVDLGAALQSNSPTVDVALAPRDQLTIYSIDDLSDIPTVRVRGSVRKPGTYPLEQGMKVSDLIYEAGGLKDDAYRIRGTLARTEVKNGSTLHTFLDVDLASALKRGATADPPLHRYDELFIQEASNWHQPWEVNIQGEVQRPGPYSIWEGERLSELFFDCGGLRPAAYLSATVFERLSVQQSQQSQLNESRNRLKEDLARIALMPESAGEKSDKASQISMVQNLLQETSGQNAVGRVALNLTSLDALPSSPSDLVLENGDVVVVPRTPPSVNVLGQVYNPVALVYEPEMKVKDYLQRAGGATETADASHILVIKANGAIMTDQSYQDARKSQIFPMLPLISGGLMDAYLQPGDTVFVPAKLLYTSGLQYAKDITTIIASSVQAIAIFGILASQI